MKRLKISFRISVKVEARQIEEDAVTKSFCKIILLLLVQDKFC